MVKGGLKLKRELAPSPVIAPTGPFTVAHLWVDTTVYHLDSEFSYLIPGNLASNISIGSFVLVPFHGRELIGCVVALDNPGSMTGLKSINKVIGNIPLLSSEILTLISSLSKRYAAHPFDLIRSAVADRVVSVEKEFPSFDTRIPNKQAKPIQQYLQLPPAKSRANLIAQKISALAKDGSVLVLLPDTREVTAVEIALQKIDIETTVLDSQLPKSQYFRNFLKVRTGQSTVVLGTRSAIFAPVINLSSILIYNEGSEHFYERRTPGWNVRDIALLRRQHENVNLIFVGYSPSTEIGRLIEEGWIDFKRVRAKSKVGTFSQSHSELLPSRALARVKKSLAEGPVLFVVPSKGYAQAISCSHCKTISRCSCGGAHIKSSATAPISCSHCFTAMPQWKCAWCNNPTPSLQSRGIDRHLHELGLLLPNTKALLVTADHFSTEIVDSGIVITTPGMAPPTINGYAAVVFLEGNRFLNQPDMRASERVREMYFSHAALAKAGAPILLVQDEGHSISAALSIWNPVMAIRRDLEERCSLGLPPYVRAALLTMENQEIVRLKNALSSSKEEGRLPRSMKLLGPIPTGDKSALILTVDIAEGETLIRTLHEFMRRRSAAKKSLPTLRIDPYSLAP